MTSSNQNRHSTKKGALFGIITFLCLLNFSIDLKAQQSFITSHDLNADVVPRLAYNEADAAITSQDGLVDLLLTGDALILQFSDKKLDKISAEILEKDSGYDESHFVSVLKSMISSGVRTLLDRGLAIPLYEISSVEYTSGRLMILNIDGKEILKDVEIGNKPLMEQFSRRDVRGFIAEVERRMI
jgi:hypothetical protein